MEMFWKMTFHALNDEGHRHGFDQDGIFRHDIAIVGCYYGLNVQGGRRWCGQGTTTAVVPSLS